MAWETRGTGGRMYFYRKIRTDGRVVSEYVGSGPLATFAASRAEDDRRERAVAATTERAERNRMCADEAELDGFCILTDALAMAALLNAGYHQHHRGEWRKRRG